VSGVDRVKARWFDARPWQTNAALIAIGIGLIGFTRQLISEKDHYTIGLSGCSSSSMVLYLAALLILWLKPDNVNRYTFGIILTFAVACRLVALFPDPFLSTDVYRYAWDGVVQHSHHNPYLYVANDPVLKELQAPNIDLYDNMNRRDYAHTIYPPVAQVIFYLITWISPTVTMMKTAMLLFEGLTLYGLMLLLKEFGLRREQAIVYAWCPLLIWEFGSSGHLDAVAMAFIVLAILFRYREKPVWVGVFLGLAFLTKLYPIVLLPALWRRGDWKMPAVIAAMTVGFYSIYLSAGKMVFGFLGAYAQEEGLESGTRYFLLEAVQHVPGLHGTPNWVFLAFAGLVGAGVMVWTWRVATPRDAKPAAFLTPAFGVAVALMLLFSPHYPWYIAWLIPFLCLMPNLPVLAYVGGLFYLCTTAIAVGTGPKQFLLNEYLYSAVAIAIIIELALRRLPQTRGWFLPAPSESVTPSISASRS
jgi:alpha-1,6-mannosyltransferase